MIIEKDKNLKNYHTLKIESVAEYFCQVNTKEEIIEALKYAKQNNLEVSFIGGGSNIAFIRSYIPGLVIKNNYQKVEIIKNDTNNLIVSVSSGYPTSKFVLDVANLGGEGIEYHLGLPGTIGGAIFTNAKWTKPLSYISDCLKTAIIIDKKLKLKTVDCQYFKFRYDYSILKKTKEIVLEVVFEFKKNDPELLKKRAQAALEYRKKTQPQGVFTAGCFFQNPKNLSAGYLIDKAELKGMKIGGFLVSPIHANFIINHGNGKPEDLKKLVNLIKKKVKEKLKVKLEEEVVTI
jgi:UDP-N-acetylmuramate dehydrogenase